MTGRPDAAGTALPTAPRGRGLARVTLAAAVAVAALIALATYRTLDAVDLASLHPFAAALAWLAVLGVAVVAAAGVVLLAVVACVRCRPRRVAALALAAAVVLPFPAIGLALPAGWGAFRANAVEDLRADAELVRSSLAVLESWGVETGALREWIDAVPG